MKWHGVEMTLQRGLAMVKVEKRTARMSRVVIREKVTRVLEAAWGSEGFDLTIDEYGQVLAELFPSVYGEKIDKGIESRKVLERLAKEDPERSMPDDWLKASNTVARRTSKPVVD